MSKWTTINWDEAMLEAAKRGLEKAAQIIEGQVARITPVGQYPKGSRRVGGRLKGSITYATRTNRSRVSGVAHSGDEVSTPPDDFTAHVGTNVEYAPYVEYRWGGKHSYLRKGFDVSKVAAQIAYSEELSKELKRRAQ
jgi:phage gpG-like protein